MLSAPKLEKRPCYIVCMSKLKTDLPVDELTEASEVLERKAHSSAIESASTQELLELIRMQHAMRTELTSAVAVLRASKVRRLH
jgi:hypothetical protein